MNFKKKRSFFDKLTGREAYEDVQPGEYDMPIAEYDQEEIRPIINSRPEPARSSRSMFSAPSLKQKLSAVPPTRPHDGRSTWMDEQGDEGELSIDMYQTPENIIVRAMIPGVKREDFDISLTRDTLSIKGKRTEETPVADQDYFHRELHWGSFSRQVELPHEIDIEQSEAIEKAGMLTLILPRIDKERQAKLRIKSV